MAYSTTYLYPEDLNGTLPSNLITNETQTLQAPGPNDYYFIIPHAAPFFVSSLKVVLTSTNRALVEGDDYQVGHLFIEAMESTGRPIAGSIRFMKPTIVGQVKLTYRTIGGPWGFSDQAILRELSNKQLNPLTRSWGDIDTLPYAFPPLPHDQRIDTLVGSDKINETLNKIADILEATAEGTSKSHIDDHNNPHQVNKIQIGLGNVPNFAMATDQQHLDANRNDLFANPRGILLMINKYAVDPMDAHIRAKGNVHDMVAADIGLGNVPNWVPATPITALDPTNNQAFMSPYTVSLLIQSRQNDPRLDQLIIDFNKHIQGINPHNITPALIGTYPASVIDQKLAEISQGGDAVTFDGQTPGQWEAKFPSVADINQILEELAQVYITASQALTLVDVEDPITPEEIAKRNTEKINWCFGEYNAYALYNSIGDARIVADTAYSGSFPKTAMANAAGKWSTAEGGGYFVNPNGSVSSWGPSPITIPTAYSQAGFQPGSEVATLYASKDHLYLFRQADSKLIRVPRTGSVVDMGVITNLQDMFTNNGTIDPRPFIIVETRPAGSNVITYTPYGDTGWVSAINTLKASMTTGGYAINDLRIGSEYLMVLTEKSAQTNLWLYKINYGATVSLTDVTATTMLRDHSTDTMIAASAVRGLTTIAGSFNHFVMTKPIGPDTTLCDLFSFGDDSNGQLEITPTSAPFLGVAAGYGFTITINRLNFAEFWGNSPDNSMFWRGGAYIST